MPVEENDKRLTFMSRTQILKRRGPSLPYHDYWWCCCPDRGLIFFNGAPQANSNQELAIDLCQRLYPWAWVEQFKLVLVEWDE